MSCYGQGRCRFCCQKHTLPVFGSEENEHRLIQRTNLKLLVLNTVCSSCITKIEAHGRDIDFRSSRLRTVERECDANNESRSADGNRTEEPSASEFRDRRRRFALESRTHADTPFVSETKPTSYRKESAHAVELQEPFVGSNRGADPATMKRPRSNCDFRRKEFGYSGDLGKAKAHTAQPMKKVRSGNCYFAYRTVLGRSTMPLCRLDDKLMGFS